MGRLDTANIQLHTEPSNVGELVREVVASMHNVIDGRPLNVVCDEHPPALPSIEGWSSWRSSSFLTMP